MLGSFLTISWFLSPRTWLLGFFWWMLWSWCCFCRPRWTEFNRWTTEWLGLHQWVGCRGFALNAINDVISTSTIASGKYQTRKLHVQYEDLCGEKQILITFPFYSYSHAAKYDLKYDYTRRRRLLHYVPWVMTAMALSLSLSIWITSSYCGGQ